MVQLLVFSTKLAGRVVFTERRHNSAYSFGSSFQSGCGISSHFEKNPRFKAFFATVLFPSGVLGPVDFKAFRRLASAFLEEAGGFSPVMVDSRV